MRVPTSITPLESPAIPDAGSQIMYVTDELGDRRCIFLAAGATERHAGSERLCLDGEPIAPGSSEEARLVALLERTSAGHRHFVDGKWVDDPLSTCAAMVTCIRSARFRRGCIPEPDPMDDVRALLLDGQRQRAILRYREIWTPLALADARVAVDEMIADPDGAGQAKVPVIMQSTEAPCCPTCGRLLPQSR
jgi:hypothetical protein